MIKVTFKVDDVIKRVQRMMTLAGDLRPVLLKIRGESLSQDRMTVIGGITGQFITEGSFYGTPWKALNFEYAQWKAKKYPGQTILRRTDRLFKAAAVQNSPGNVEILTSTRLSWGVSDEIKYAAIHQKTRPFLAIIPKQVEKWKRLISGYLLDTGAT